MKAIALGADAVSIGTAALLALGCHLCQDCTSGNCNWGIATQKPELCTRLQPAWGSRQLIHLLNAWTREIKEMMGGMGINSIEALRGNRLMLAALDLNETECEILGVRYAGEVRNMLIDAKKYNAAQINELAANSSDAVIISDCCAQRYLGCGLSHQTLLIDGTPGNDLGAMMNGAMIVLQGNAQEGLGNTMNAGTIVVHGHCGDLCAYSMRGGKIYVRDGAGVRCGIHMKEYKEHKPILSCR